MTRKSIFKLVLLSLLLNSSGVFAADNSAVLGQWVLDMTVQGQEVSINLTIVEDGDGLGGTWVSRQGTNALSDINFDGDTLSFSRQTDQGPVEVALKLEGNTLDGSVSTLLGATPILGSKVSEPTEESPSPYEATEEWPSPYNGVTPDSSFGLASNNIGVFSANDSIIYTCLRIFTDGLPGSAGGISEFDVNLTLVSIDEATFQITHSREFNSLDSLNENAEFPGCSGKFETTTSVYTDFIEVGDSILDTTWNLIDPTNLILKLSSYQELTAN